MTAPEDTPEILPPEEAEVWANALSVYSAFAGRDLLFDAELNGIGRELSRASSDLSDISLPVDLRQALVAARPIYDKRFWERHQALNDEWCRKLEPLLTAHSGPAMARLRKIYGTPGPAILPVEVTRYANWAGAYTALDPVEIIIASGYPANQGPAALEIVLHEASHAMAGPLMRSLDEARARHADESGRPAAPHDLWHQILFYLTGEVVSDVLPGYVPYADQNGLWARVWPAPGRDLLAKHLDPLLREEIALDAAIDGLVADWVRSSPRVSEKSPGVR